MKAFLRRKRPEVHVCTFDGSYLQSGASAGAYTIEVVTRDFRDVLVESSFALASSHSHEAEHFALFALLRSLLNLGHAFVNISVVH